MPKTAAHAKLGKWLAETRQALGMSQAQFAREVRKSQSFIAKTEIGERRLDVIEFVELAAALRTSPRKLFDRLLDYLG